MLRPVILLLTAAAAVLAEPSTAKLVRQGDGWQLLRNGKPYYIHGGGGGRAHIDKLAAAGGNSVRTYAGSSQLDDYHAKGISVMVGLDVGKPRNGFDYGDRARVAQQLERLRESVEKLKDHPAVLMWALGNEVELAASDVDRIRVWEAMNEMAKAVHAADARHPVIVVLAGVGKTKLAELNQHCPEIDAVGINAYGGMLSLPEAIAAQQWNKPYIVTEFGPRGHWEVAKTPWGLPVEDTSTEKAEFYLKAYQRAIGGQPACVGSYVFLWGQKQEKTHTWYGMFLPEGNPLGAVDTMTYAWTGKWPANRAPRIDGRVRLAGPDVVKPGAELKVSVAATDPDGDDITVKWDLRLDVSDNPGRGGDREPPTPALVTAEGKNATLRVPDKPANYRVFVYVFDPQGKAATANLAVRAE